MPITSDDLKQLLEFVPGEVSLRGVFETLIKYYMQELSGRNNNIDYWDQRIVGAVRRGADEENSRNRGFVPPEVRAQLLVGNYAPFDFQAMHWIVRYNLYDSRNPEDPDSIQAVYNIPADNSKALFGSLVDVNIARKYASHPPENISQVDLIWAFYAIKNACMNIPLNDGMTDLTKQTFQFLERMKEIEKNIVGDANEDFSIDKTMTRKLPGVSRNKNYAEEARTLLNPPLPPRSETQETSTPTLSKKIPETQNNKPSNTSKGESLFENPPQINIETLNEEDLIRKVNLDRNPEDMYTLSYCIEQGLVSIKGEKAVALWVREAADCGHKDAMRVYAKCLEQGYGVEKNETDAMKWKQKAE